MNIVEATYIWLGVIFLSVITIGCVISLYCWLTEWRERRRTALFDKALVQAYIQIGRRLHYDACYISEERDVYNFLMLLSKSMTLNGCYDVITLRESYRKLKESGKYIDE